ncbi:MAG: hypothetical protein K0Q85_436 [Caproiciproducens sp.]|nr:hypothetical protein [Caproiciproducens sp.]
MTNGLNELLANNSEISQYYSSLPQSVKNEVSSCGQEIFSLDDLLRIIKQCSGTN